MLQVLTRYDGWFVTLVELGILFSLEFIYHRKSFAESLSKIILVCVPIAFGIGLWLLWNLLIFGDPFFFAFGPYSAHAQQEFINASGGLITKGNLALSFQAYIFALIHNAGFLVTALSIFGSLTFLFFKNNFSSLGIKSLIFILFLSPVIFNVLALFLGFSILNVPELNWNPGKDSSGFWFNVRYGILGLPAIALWLGFLSSRKTFFALISAFIIVLQMFVTYRDGVITIVDGTVGSSAYRKQDISTHLKENVKSSDTVLMSIGFNNPVAFRIGLPLKNIIHEGVSKKWPDALNNPEKYADWIVVSNTANGDPLYEALMVNQKDKLLANYEVEYKGNEATIYKRKGGLFHASVGGNQ